MPDLRGTIELMVSQFRAMPPGLRIFLLYAFFILLCAKGYIDWRKTAVAALQAAAIQS